MTSVKTVYSDVHLRLNSTHLPLKCGCSITGQSEERDDVAGQNLELKLCVAVTGGCWVAAGASVM